MKKLAILIYPEFSIQEISDMMYLFRWYFDVKTEIIASNKEIVISEEGVSILPDKTVNEFTKSDYYCLILPGCSDFREPIRDKNLINFLFSFKNVDEFLIPSLSFSSIFLIYACLMKSK